MSRVGGDLHAFPHVEFSHGIEKTHRARSHKVVNLNVGRQDLAEPRRHLLDQWKQARDQPVQVVVRQVQQLGVRLAWVGRLQAERVALILPDLLLRPSTPKRRTFGRKIVCQFGLERHRKRNSIAGRGTRADTELSSAPSGSESLPRTRSGRGSSSARRPKRSQCTRRTTGVRANSKEISRGLKSASRALDLAGESFPLRN